MPSKRHITSVDVANEAGCSQATVSYVLSGRWREFGIRPETRDRVVGVAERLGYRPNKLARSLKMGRSHVIGIVAPCVTFSYFSEIIRGAEDVLSENGYVLVLTHSDEDPDRERRNVGTLMQYNVDGLLIIPAGQGANGKVFERIEKDRLPCVFVDKKAAKREHAFVGTDDFGGALQAMHYLISLGHRRISFIRGPQVSSVEERFEGYLEGLREGGLDRDDRLITECDWSQEGGAIATRRFLARQHRPTAIFACNDVIAWGVYKGVAEAGLRVPEDMSVVGFADLKPSDLLSVPLTTLRQPSRDVGQRAAEMLLDLLKKKPNSLQQVQLPTKLVIRRSCCPPRTTSIQG